MANTYLCKSGKTGAPYAADSCSIKNAVKRPGNCSGDDIFYPHN
jgi:hypothetical protein